MEKRKETFVIGNWFAKVISLAWVVLHKCDIRAQVEGKVISGITHNMGR